ncbi:long-chain fatty acid--CoA ligase [Cryobacterium sp. TMS1-20-1]|uniref:class I adenylate-forming enzyme family protein n=1 Tax=Cryobacterium sp. TMS1-20-1 TaxID=1259223 RepID=UPI00106C525D|nr:class I adenylate-forming enzyme family protein [Cryobacterium sp. TMS1-20-1]TFC80553.1 long-chain fatty acid--CoA ligase [Cryobacterium sp. TMS1-20-1]
MNSESTPTCEGAEDIADAFGTVAALILSAAANRPRGVAIRDADGAEVTYEQMVSAARRIANGLRAQGMAVGGRVAVWLPDTSGHIEMYVACAIAGFVVVPINARYTAYEAAHIVSDSTAALLVHADRPPGEITALAGLVSVPMIDLGPGSDVVFKEHPALEFSSHRVQPNMPFIIGYTSGTTGKPKGAVLTQSSVAKLAQMNARSYRLRRGSVALLTGSMSFVAVVPAHVISHFHVQGTIVLPGAWDVPRMIDLIDAHDVTFTYVPSPLVLEFADEAASRPDAWKTLESILHSASKIPPASLARLADVVGTRLIEGWGMTEHSGGLMSATSIADVAPGQYRRLTGVGRAVDEVDIDVRATDGSPIDHDGEALGELWIRSPALFKGYWELPEASANALQDGWFRTGDLGTIDPGGYVVIVERRSDLIVSGGMNVYPSEVEECIAEIPGVREVAVVGMPHPRWGHAVVAVVVSEPEAHVTVEDVLTQCRAHLASFKKPTRVEFVGALPRTTSLKVSRNAVREALR